MFGEVAVHEGDCGIACGGFRYVLCGAGVETVFLEEVFRLLDDGVKRYFVPEVNS
jgi:hypothetical protein